MPDLETAVRSAIGLLCRRYRVVSIPAADDEAVSAILRAAGKMADDAAQAAQVAEHGLSAMDHAGAREVAAEMLAAFKPGPNGCSARVKAEQVEEWRQRLGEQG